MARAGFNCHSSEESTMNKRFATFIFAISIGLTAAPAFASCYHYCAVDYQSCMASGADPAECNAEVQACQADCGCQEECCSTGCPPEMLKP
jgi:hypothetical protein